MTLHDIAVEKVVATFEVDRRKWWIALMQGPSRLKAGVRRICGSLAFPHSCDHDTSAERGLIKGLLYNRSCSACFDQLALVKVNDPTCGSHARLLSQPAFRGIGTASAWKSQRLPWSSSTVVGLPKLQNSPIFAIWPFLVRFRAGSLWMDPFYILKSRGESHEVENIHVENSLILRILNNSYWKIRGQSPGWLGHSQLLRPVP